MSTLFNDIIDKDLARAQVAIDNTLNDPDVLSAVSLRGYDEPKMQAGKTLYNTALNLHMIQKKEYGEKLQATKNFHDILKEINELYMEGVVTARVVFKEKLDKWQAIGLNGKRKKTYSGWVEQTQQFYINSLNDPEIMEGLLTKCYSKEMLEAEYQGVKNVIAANANKIKESGESQEATKVRDKAMDELNQWISDYKAIAKIALKKNPQWIEKLGLEVVK